MDKAIISGEQGDVNHRTYSKTSLKTIDILLNPGNVGSGGFKSPFEKGGFRGISGGYINPPFPPFSKGDN